MPTKPDDSVWSRKQDCRGKGEEEEESEEIRSEIESPQSFVEV